MVELRRGRIRLRWGQGVLMRGRGGNLAIDEIEGRSGGRPMREMSGSSGV